MDPMPEIVEIVRSAIKDGLINTESLPVFNDAVQHLKGPALEDYIQNLWDTL